MRKLLILLILCLIFAPIIGVVVLAVTSGLTMPGNPMHTAADPAGFWSGLWHGFIVCISFIWNLFDPSVGIYEVNNNGGWYNFGFLWGCGVIFGGGASSSSRRRS